jgi:ATP-dependent DNA helicase RecG
MNELVAVLGLKTKTSALKQTVGELLHEGLIAYTIADKPSSRLQQYRLTDKGRACLEKGDRGGMDGQDPMGA